MGSERAQGAGIGFAFGIAAYGTWGLVPVYFKAVGSVAALEVLCHRIVWSVVVLAVVVHLRKQWSALAELLHRPRAVAVLGLTTVLIAINWFVFIWAVDTGKVLQASLGYFINPLVNIALGVIFLRESLSRVAIVSVVLAGLGVGYQTFLVGELPWISLALATSFGLYGLLRKTVAAGPVVGLAVETSLLAPVAAAYFVWLSHRGELSFLAISRGLDITLVAAGLVTAVPLIWFTAAARILPLSTMGFLQYLSPTGHFVLAVAVYGEAFSLHHGLSFAFIWTALGLFSADQLRHHRTLRRMGAASCSERSQP